MREINKVLSFREDISPFLVHLTKNTTFEGENKNAKDNLLNILKNRRLDPGDCLLDAKNGYNYRALSSEQQKDFFNAICFTETPISEIHCLLEIDQRRVDLSSYGVVFLKDELRKNNVGPVFYVNNYSGNNDDIFYAICSMINNNPEAAKKFLPMFAVIGKKVIQPSYSRRFDEFAVDFSWEREWRRPRYFGNMNFQENDVFVGLCPDEEICYFESQIRWLSFIDPRRNIKWYADKLIAARQRCDLKSSVV